MEPEQLRMLGHRMVDWVVDYLERIESLPVLSRAEPGDLLAALPKKPPQEGFDPGEWDQVFNDLDNLILPGITHWQSPSFFAYFSANSSGPSILGELLCAGLGTQGMLWATSPAATELEIRMLEWLGDMLELPPSLKGPQGGGCIQGTASESTLVAMIAARKRVLESTGAAPDKLVAYASTQAHSSVVKAAMIAGLCHDASGGDALHSVAVDRNLAMDPTALAQAMQADRVAGRIPFFACATVGTTSSGAVDPVRKIADILAESNFVTDGGWLHIDAAYAGAGCICPEHRHLLEGVEQADSICFNAHKWLLTNFDCSCFWTRDRTGLINALSVTPEYLRNHASDAGDVIDYRDWQIPLGRRFRALKLWLVIRHYGVEGLQEHVRHHVRLAELFAELVRADERFEICAPPSLGLVCFRLPGEDADAKNRELLARLNATGEAYISHTTLPLPAPDGSESYVLRMAIGATMTEERHVRAAWDLISRLA